MKDADYYAIRKREDEIEEGIQKIREGEKYGNLVRQDLHRLMENGMPMNIAEMNWRI